MHGRNGAQIACNAHVHVKKQAACHIAEMGGTEESLHDEYQGTCHVAINQGVVLRLNLQQVSQQASQARLVWLCNQRYTFCKAAMQYTP